MGICCFEGARIGVSQGPMGQEPLVSLQRLVEVCGGRETASGGC